MASHTPAIAMAVNPPGTNNIRMILQAIDCWLLKLRIAIIARPSFAISFVIFPLAALQKIHRIKTTFIFAEIYSYF